MTRSAGCLAALLVALWIPSGRGQTGSIGGSVLGYVFDARVSGLRPILGIPGAATLGAPLDLGLALDAAFVAPHQNFALALAGGTLRVVQFDPPVSRPLDALGARADLVAFSPSGSTALLYDRSAAVLRVITGLPERPALSASLDAGALGAPVTAIAASDDGAVLAASSDGTSGAVSTWDAAGSARMLFGLPHPSALAFVPGSRDALVADDAANQVYRLRDVSGAAEPERLSSEGIERPVAVAAHGNRWAFVAGAASKNVVRLDLSGGAAISLDCDCVPSALGPLNGSAVFRLTEPSDSPMWLLDGEPSQPRLVFVPPGGQPGEAGSRLAGRPAALTARPATSNRAAR